MPRLFPWAVLALCAGPLVVRGAEPAPVKAKIAAITLKGALPESAGQLGLLGELENNLGDFLARLERAGRDPSITAVVLHVREPSLGWGQLHEIRSALARLRKTGKKVVARLDEAGTQGYLAASACDEIIMPESGLLMLPGLRAELMFYKKLLGHAGVSADMVQVGKYKGAAEPYTREAMSPEFRAQFESLVDDLFAQLVESIAEGRKLPRDEVEKLVDRGLFTAPAALAAKLIDRVEYRDGLEATLRAKHGAIEIVKDYGKKQLDTDFSGMLGMVKLFDLLLGGGAAARSSGNKKIAVVYAVGAIMTGESSTSLFGEQVLGGETMVQALRQAEEDESVVAIVLRVDSPGGSAIASDLIWREIRRIEKPIVASMGDTAASGGYYISMGADQIYAEPGTLTGSIGVVGGKLVLGGLYDKVGLTTEVVSRGRNAGLLSSREPFTESERAAMLEMMNEVYGQFTRKAAEGRKLEPARLEELAQGRLWTGRQAQERGLVDKIGALHDALRGAKELAGVPVEEKVELLILPKPRSLFDELLGVSASTDLASPLASRWAGELAPELRETWRDARTLRRMFDEKALLWLPFRVNIR